MTPECPKGPESEARPEVLPLTERVATVLADQWNNRRDPDDHLDSHDFADEALAVCDELGDIRFEYDAAQATAATLVQQLTDLRDDVLGDESIQIPEVISAASRELERLTAEVALYRERDGLTRKALLHDGDGPLQFAALIVRQQRDKALAEVTRLTAEVERLRQRVHEVVDETQRRYAPFQSRCHKFDVWSKWARDAYERHGGLWGMESEATRLVVQSLLEERDEWKQAAEAEADLLDQANAEVSRLQQLAAQPSTDLVERAAVWLFRAKTSRLKQADAAYAQRTWDDVLDVRDTDAWKRYAEAMLVDLRLGVSSSEVEAPQPALVQHKVTLTDERDGVYAARCGDCRSEFLGTQWNAEDWKDQHEADTLRPQAFADYDLMDVKPGTGFFVPKDEGRPSGSKAAEPRPNEAVVDNALSDALTDQYGFLPLGVRYGAAKAAREIVEQWLDSFTGPEDAAQAARSEATLVDPHFKFDCPDMHECPLHSPSPSLRKEGDH